MTKPRKRPAGDSTGALIFGIIFTVVGGALMVERATGVHVWEYLWRLWPLLLIIMGIKILADHYASQSRPKEPR